MASGLRHLNFRCTACANCCKELRVPLTSADLGRLVAKTGRPASELVDWLETDSVDLTGEPGSLVVLEQASKPALMTLAHRGNACLFLGLDARCAVYDARPGSCRLYPFDLTFGPRGGVRRLRLLGGTRCDYARDGHNDPHALREADQQRWSEHRAYLAQVQTWNRSQRHRLRFGHRALGSREFLHFLSVASEATSGNGS
ncbi:MAG TPA: YkgJ family cysteine cluster protein [Polyangiaceae bacterium]|nr:YkgJ family cysteine cluster protein [Polyangiaceae bacterium]